MKTIIVSAMLALALGVSVASAQPAPKQQPAPYTPAAQSGELVVVKVMDDGRV